MQEDGPKYDYGRGDYELARSKLTNIGHVNGVYLPGSDQAFTKLFQKEIDESPRLQEDDHPLSIKKSPSRFVD